MHATYHTKSPQETIALGEKLGHLLQPGNVVLLFGELGSGKTHFAKGIAKGLGVEQKIKSPTFVYVNQYSIDKSQISNPKFLTLCHYDFYRLNIGDDLTSLGYEESLNDPQAINVVEWADRLGDDLPAEYIRVELETLDDAHQIKIEFISPQIVMEDMVTKFYEEWGTPLRVQNHCKQVASVAKQIAEAYIQQGEIINLNLLYTAALLHDMCRICDIKELERDHFNEEEIGNNKWEKWSTLRKKYHGIDHEEIASQELQKLGFTQTAEVIRLHRSALIIQESEAFDSLEKKIMYYADKRVLHSKIVTLKKRFEDGRERYGQFDDEETKRFFKKVEKRTFELEKELFEKLNIKSENIV